MSDIPVGSPPAPPGRHAAPGGWYPDPLDVSRERYWDGWQWSRNTREAEGRPVQRQTVGSPVGPTPYGIQHAGPYGSVPAPAAPVPGPTTADGVPLAGWWWRALAGSIDALIVGLVSLLVTLPFYRPLFVAFGAWWGDAFRLAQAGGQPPPTPNFAAMITPGDQLLVTLVTLALGLAYHLPFLRVRGATPGLLACSLRVVPVDVGLFRERLSWSCVIIRTLLWVLPGALGLRILTVADVLVPLWHPKRQALHDLAARTQVVRLR